MPATWSRFLSIIFLGWLLAFGQAKSAEKSAEEKTTPTKVAVVDVGSSQKVPPAFLDLMMLSLGKRSRVVLLERGDVVRLLREQRLSLSLARPVEADAAVQAGKRWSADVFLLLEASKPTGGELPVRARLVDARSGVKLADTAFVVRENGSGLAAMAELMADAVETKIAAAGGNADACAIGVMTFRSEEVSKSWDWLSESLAAGVEQHLALVPRVVLLERSRTRTLIEERTLSAGLPERLQASAVLVDGSFRLNRDKEKSAVVVRVRCRRGGKTVLDRETEGSLKEPGRLALRVAQLVSTAAVGPASDPLAPEIEARLLETQARAYLTTAYDSNEPERAIALADAALALQPDSIVYRYLILEALLRKVTACTRDVLRTRGPKSARWPETLTALDRAVLLAERVVAAEGKGLPPHWHMAVPVLAAQAQNLIPAQLSSGWKPDADTADVYDSWRHGMRKLHARVASQFPRWEVGAEFAATTGYMWCETPEEALKLVEGSVEKAAGAFREKPSVRNFVAHWGFQFRLFAGTPAWSDRPDLAALFDAHLLHLREHRHPLVRLAGEYGTIYYFSTNYGTKEPAKALRHARAFFRILTREVMPHWSNVENAYDIWAASAIGNTRLAQDQLEDAAARVELLGDLLENVVRKRNRAGALRNWASCLNSYSLALEKLGRSADALKYFQDLQDQLRASGRLSTQDVNTVRDALDGLRQRHPELTTADAGPNPYLAKPLLLAQDHAGQFFPEARTHPTLRFRCIVLGTNLAAIFYSGEGQQSERHGLVRLDPRTFRPLNFTFLPEFVPEQQNSAVEHRPLAQAVANGQDIYVSLPRGGILCFPAKGRPRRLTEKDGLPSDKIRSIATLGGKLYAVMGAKFEDTGLAELDPNTGKSVILFSSKSKEGGRGLDGETLTAVLADPTRGRLLVGTDGLYDPTAPLNWRPGGLYSYGLREKKLEKLLEVKRGVVGLRSCQGLLLVVTQRAVLRVDPVTGKGASLLDTDFPGWTPFSSKPSIARRIVFSPFVVAVGRELLYGDQYGATFLRSYTPGAEDTVSVWGRVFPGSPPRRHALRDIAMSDRRLLLLTDDGLYHVPGVKGEP